MGSQVSSFAFGFLLFCAVASAQASISGRVVDETGAGIASARVELRAGSGISAVSSSDRAGNFKIALAGGR